MIVFLVCFISVKAGSVSRLFWGFGCLYGTKEILTTTQLLDSRALNGECKACKFPFLSETLIAYALRPKYDAEFVNVTSHNIIFILAGTEIPHRQIPKNWVQHQSGACWKNSFNK